MFTYSFPCATISEIPKKERGLEMGIVVGIDIGGSTTKIVGFNEERQMLKPIQISANSAIASIFGAFGKFLYDNKLELNQVERVNLTGVGAGTVDKAIYGLPTYFVPEFTANGVGGGYFADGKDEFMVISMGTGTSYVGVKKGISTHLGGIGIGGGTINGLSKYILGNNDIEKILDLAKKGNFHNIDLSIGDITESPIDGLDFDITASNFGKASYSACIEDKAAGLVHMVIETICQTASLIARGYGFKNFVMIGSLTNFEICGDVVKMIKSMSPDYSFIVPEEGEFGTAIGCALVDKKYLTHVAG